MALFLNNVQRSLALLKMKLVCRRSGMVSTNIGKWQRILLGEGGEAYGKFPYAR
jgi:hypothetical protein